MDGERSKSLDIPSLLQTGEILRLERAPRSYNATFVAEIGDGTWGSCRAIYKPCRGEAPLWDFPPDTLYKREYLAYRVSEALGWGLVPLTVIRDGPYGVGSVQHYIDAQRGRHYFNLVQSHRPAMVRMTLLDCLLNNADRKAGHCLLDSEGRVWAIDHGLSFLPGAKLRTVMWDLGDEVVPGELKREIAPLLTDGALRAALSLHLSGVEAAAFYGRVEDLLSCATIPLHRYADPYRPYPWPAI